MKKMMIALTAMFVFGTAYANPSLSWREILTDSNFHVSFPMIGFKYAAVSVDAVCLDGDSVRPFNPKHEHCVAWDNNSENPACIATETVALSAPLRSKVTECAAWEYAENPVCREYRTVEKVLPLIYNVDVLDAQSFGSEPGAHQVLFTKQYTIPACN